MRAAVLEGPQRIAIRNAPRPGTHGHQVRIRLDGCGLCGSDLPSWEGREWMDYPLTPGAPGHEAWGIVEEVGPRVKNVKPGDRVAGLFHEAFAEEAVTTDDQVLTIPDALDGHPFAGEPLACAANAVRRSRVKEGETAVVIGIGFIGAAITAFARAQGAHVIAASRREYAQQIARKMGAATTFPLEAGAIENHLQDRSDKDGEQGLADVVFEVTGKQAPLDLATRLTRTRGRLVVAGFHQDGPRNVDMQLWNWRGLDVINAHERHPEEYMKGMRHASQLITDGATDVSPLYTHHYPLERLDEAFTCMKERPDGFLKAVIGP